MHSTPSLEQVQSASPEDLILMLFEGAIRFGNEADEALVRGDRATAAGLVGRVRAIVEELDRGLNPAAGSITRHLGAIYEYVLRRLDPDTVDSPTLREVIADLQVLCEAWTALVAERRAEAHEDSHAPALA
ncbi:MAG: flagellar protein FliS [Thermoleophilia bacterium]|nr:flagellar protein FliS [Thermoleophilia bacterium]